MAFTVWVAVMVAAFLLGRYVIRRVEYRDYEEELAAANASFEDLGDSGNMTAAKFGDSEVDSVWMNRWERISQACLLFSYDPMFAAMAKEDEKKSVSSSCFEGQRGKSIIGMIRDISGLSDLELSEISYVDKQMIEDAYKAFREDSVSSFNK